MNENGWLEKEPLRFIVNAEEEFLNIFQYKNVRCFKFSNYIYIGQVKKENETQGGGENEENETIKQSEDIKKLETKEFYTSREKLEKRKKRKGSKYVKDGYGILITLSKNNSDQEIIVNKFIGNWKNDKKSGLGFNLYLNKNIYFGYYENDMRNGWGYFEWKSNGSTYEGNWLNNCMNGKGVYKNRSSNRNTNFMFDGDFHNNKFVNSSGEWIDVIELEKKIHKLNIVRINVNSNNNIDLILLPFNFMKLHLKKIADLIKYNFDKVPFIMCSKKFVEKNKNFNLSKLIFLSYYFSSSKVPFDMDWDKLLFDDFENCSSKMGKTNFKSSYVNERLSDEHGQGEGSLEATTDKCFSVPTSSSASSNSCNSHDSCFSIDSCTSHDTCISTNSCTSNASSMLLLSRGSRSVKSPKDNRDGDCDSDDLNNSGTRILDNFVINGNESRRSTGSELKEYIKNTNVSDTCKGASTSEIYVKNGNNTHNEDNEDGNREINEEGKNSKSINFIPKNDMNFSLGKGEDNLNFNTEEKRKNELNDLINKYVTIYDDFDSSSCDYSIMSSDEENSNISLNFDKTHKDKNFPIHNEHHEVKKGEIKQENEENEIDKIGMIKRSDKTSPNMNNTDDTEKNFVDNIKKQIEKELSMINMDINFLQKLRNCNVSCMYNIAKKVKNSLMMKYPFIFSLNMSQTKNKYENMDDELLLKNCTIPHYWDLTNYFGNAEDKLPAEMFTPLQFDFSKSNKNLAIFPQIGKTDDLNDKDTSPCFNLHFFFITDLFVDETEDIQNLKRLIINKFKSYLYLNNLFFVIIE
ncbi:hypothetical protein POVCU1_040440 [Plasmodium ovale curtisi]|uniref:MORN repeat protein n=1 Tax=Plasmodium ovale curtisi TaxID=864141 RepID=A0A1A8X0N9_PLAOA|nr:hypothetical protein POVCU1_040440 [Plasmodium ovale curtisi]